MASNQHEPWTIAIDDQSVYWVNEGERGGVYKVPKSGGAPTALYEGVTGAVESLGLDSTAVYLPLGDRIVAVPIAGGPVRTITSGTATNGVAVANGEVYWIDGVVPPQARKVSVSGGTPTPIALSEGTIPNGGAYFTAAARDGVYAGFHQGGIWGVPLNGAVGRLLQVPGPTRGIALDEAGIYFAANDSLWTVVKTGAAPTRLAKAELPMGVAVDDGFAYFVDSGKKGRVLRVPKAGGIATTLADDQRGPHAIAVDADNVYWNCIPGGTILKLAK